MITELPTLTFYLMSNDDERKDGFKKEGICCTYILAKVFVKIYFFINNTDQKEPNKRIKSFPNWLTNILYITFIHF